MAEPLMDLGWSPPNRGAYYVCRYSWCPYSAPEKRIWWWVADDCPGCRQQKVLAADQTYPNVAEEA